MFDFLSNLFGMGGAPGMPAQGIGPNGALPVPKPQMPGPSMAGMGFDPARGGMKGGGAALNPGATMGPMARTAFLDSGPMTSGMALGPQGPQMAGGPPRQFASSTEPTPVVGANAFGPLAQAAEMQAKPRPRPNPTPLASGMPMMAEPRNPERPLGGIFANMGKAPEQTEEQKKMAQALPLLAMLQQRQGMA